MGLRRSKKEEIDKSAWLDWLSDDMPAGPSAASAPSPAPQPAQHPQPIHHHHRPTLAQTPPTRPLNRPQHTYSQQAPLRSHAAPSYRPVSPMQAVPQPLSAPVRPMAPPPQPIVATPAAVEPVHTTVSINIHLPKMPKRVKAWWQLTVDELGDSFHAVKNKAKANRRGAFIAVGIVAVVLLGVFVPPIFLGHHGAGSAKGGHKAGSSSGSSAGGSFTAQQPNFDVVAPAKKPQLAKADGVNTAFDSQRASYSYKDSLQHYSLIVSEQPIPSKFSTGQDAVDQIAPTLVNANATQEKLITSYGSAYVVTNHKYSSQVVVASVKKVIVFIQASHVYDDVDWISYINDLQ